MKVKTSELKEDLLNWALDCCEGEKPQVELVEDASGRLPHVFDLIHDIKTLDEVRSILLEEPHGCDLTPQELRLFAGEMGYCVDRPCFQDYTSPKSKKGAEILERESIGVLPTGRRDVEGKEFKWVSNKNWSDPLTNFYGPTARVAALRCYVASVLGLEIEVPPEMEWALPVVPKIGKFGK